MGERPAWASNPGGSCREGPTFTCEDLYCSSGMDTRLQELRDTFTSSAMALLRHTASSTCTEDEVLMAAMNIGGKVSFRNHFVRVHECWSSDWSNTSSHPKAVITSTRLSVNRGFADPPTCILCLYGTH